jgi:UDP-N-acetyl-D-mannosaminuronate dehydrogenase
MWQRKCRIAMMIGILGLGVIGLLLGISTQTSAQSTVSLVDANTEAALLAAGDFNSVAMDCDIQCADNGSCRTVGYPTKCGGLGSNCDCQWCEDQWGCYPTP